MNGIITEIKDTLEEILNIIIETEEQISELEDTMVDITETKQNKEKAI